jgi:outer membrane protein assembly factor BamB
MSKTIFVGIKGSVVALDRATGAIIWKTDLAGSDFVNLVCDQANIYATTRGEAFCLDPRSGEVRWHNPLKGLGRDLASLLVPESSEQQQTVLLAAKRRRDEAAAAAAASTPAS